MSSPFCVFPARKWQEQAAQKSTRPRLCLQISEDIRRCTLTFGHVSNNVPYALFLADLHGSHEAPPQPSVLAIDAGGALIECEGADLSPRELQGKYRVALGRIGGEGSSTAVDRHKPIYQRNVKTDEKQAIADAANALSALWKLSKGRKA